MTVLCVVHIAVLCNAVALEGCLGAVLSYCCDYILGLRDAVKVSYRSLSEKNTRMISSEKLRKEEKM